MDSGIWRAAGLAALVGPAMVAAIVTAASAAPKPGDALPAARAATLDGRELNTRSMSGKIVLIFYEDKDSAQLNMALKNELGKVQKSPGWKPNVVVAAVADVSGYDWWPARGFVKDAIQAEQRKAGTPIYLDWSGDFGKAIKAKKGASNVVLVGADGKVQIAHEGAVPQAVRDAIVAAVRKQ